MLFRSAEPNEWKYLSWHIWETHQGKAVPKGYVIRFIDGNIKNCTIENLELISQKENRLRNSIHNIYPAELKKAIQTLAGLKRKINSKKKEKSNA